MSKIRTAEFTIKVKLTENQSRVEFLFATFPMIPNLSRVLLFLKTRAESGYVSATLEAKGTLIEKVAHLTDPIVQNY